MDLYKYYLQQGVWDVLDLLYKEIGDPLAQESVEKLIWEYCFGSLNLSFPTQLVASPWQQRWLAANVLSSAKLLAGTDVNVLKREIEFQQVLDSLVGSDTPQSVVQELRELHGKVQLADRARQPVARLSPESCHFLLRSLLESPAAAHAATRELLCLWSPHFADTDAQLQDLYKEALWTCLQQIEQGHQGVEHGRAPSERQSEDTLLCLLSVLQVGEAKLRDLSDWLCTRLRSLCGAGLVEERWLHLGLLSRGALGLLRALTALEDDARSRAYVGADPAVLEAICRRIGEGHLEELFYRTVGTRRHWVEDLTVMCSALMIAGKGDVVDTCLSQPGLSTLWPIVLLHTWREFGSSSEIFDVLDVLIARSKGDVGDPALQRVTTVLEDQVDVVRWCRLHGSMPNVNNGSLLELAKDHSALEVLRRTTNLAALNKTEVRELLVTSSLSRGGVIKPSANIPNWQVITYDGFCIMMHAFTIVQSGMEFEKIRKKLSRNCDWFSTCDDMLKLLNPVLSAMLFRYYPQVHQSGAMNTEDNIKCLQQNYDEKVVKTLETMQQMICKLFPLNFRVEIMENIFSLLFLRFEDLQNESSSESGSDSEEAEAAGKDDSVLSGPLWTATELGDVFRDVVGPSASLSDIPLIKASVSESQYSGTCEQLAADAQVPQAQPLSARPPEAPDAGRGRGEWAREALDRRRKSATVGNSSKSTSDSSCATTSQGFVCGRFVVRDLIHCLKACLLDTSTSLYGSWSHEDPSEDFRDVQSSVRPEELQKRLNRLIQYVSEAAWRLELLTDSQFASSYGMYFDCKASLARQNVWAYQAETSSSESDEEAAGGGARGGRAKRGATQDLERSSSSGGLSLAAGGGPSSNSHRKMKWSKRHYQPAPLPHSHANIIRLMLSSQSSLAIRCLTQGDHVKARDVIQKFDVEGNSLVAEVKFTEAYQNLRNRLEACCALKDQSSYGSCGQSSGSSLPYKKSIENVASGVVQSSSLASQLENFLSVVPLPNLHSTNLQEQDGAPTLDGATDDAQAIIAVDLALTLGNNYQQSVSLLDVACRHCPELQGGGSAEPLGPGRKKKTLSGCLGFVRDAIGLLKEVNAEEREPGAGVLPADVSLRDLLLSAQYPLAVKPLRGVLSFWSDLDSASRDLAAAMAIEDERRRMEDTEPASEAALKNVYGAKVNACFRTLLKVSQRNVLTAGGEGNASSHLPNLYLYLKLLTTLWVQHCPTVSDSHAPATYLDIFEDSVMRFVGRLVFEYGVPPAQLEPVATRLNLNLVHKVVQNCCPHVPSALPAATGHAAGAWGRIALNQPGQASKGGTRHPETCVKVLLTSIIDTLRKYLSPGWTLSSQQQFASALEDPELTKLLAETGELATADTKMLTSVDETLSFLINLRNLLWLHSVFGPEARHFGDAAEERHLQCGGTAGVLSPCPLEQLVTMKCVGYDVGGLGFVSLYDLQVLLLGKELAHSASLPDCAGGENRTLGKLNVFSDPRIVFSLAYGQADSPKVQVMSSDNVDAQLDAHMTEYLDHFVCVEEIDGIKQLMISTLVQRYHEYVLLNQDPESYSAVLDTPDVADTSSLHRWEKLLVLLEFLKDNTTGQTREQLCELTDMRCGDVVVSVGGYPGSGVMLGYGGGGAPAREGDDADRDAWQGQVLSDPVLQFLERRCWLLAALARRLHGREGGGEAPCLDRLFSAGDDDDDPACALRAWPPPSRLWGRLGGLAGAHDWAGCVQVLRALPPARLLADPKLQALLDAVLCELAASVPSTESPCPWQYCQQIGNTGVQARCVLGNMSKWPVDVCVDALLALAEGLPGSLPPWLQSEVDGSLRRILVYQKILTGYQFPKISSWYELSYFSSCDPGLVIEHLIQSELCVEWAELHDIPSRMPQLIDYRYIALLLKRNAAEAVKLLESLPEERAVAICNKLIEELKDLSSLKTVVDVLLGRHGDLLSAEAAGKLRELLVGVQMLSALPAEERAQYVDLAGRPHLVLEELLMNTRLEALGAMLAAAAGPRADLPAGSPVSSASVDDLLRRYAGKALETGGVRARTPSGADSREDRLLASLAGNDSSSSGDAFVMPDRVPAKREWMRDDEVMQCKCCDAVFTMFNRRHHCRRCGRVVCAACSTRKIQVVGYGSVAVRACDKCYEQTELSDRLPVSSLPESALQFELQAAQSPEQLWRLAADEAHNQVVRDEFGFEHAPSVSLCLAILRLHSDNLAYARFLLNACRSMMQQLWTDVAKRASMKVCSSDLDFSLIIKMVRSLATAAKVNFSELSSVDECYSLLDETDLLAVLVEHGCTRFLPPEGLGSPGGLRKVRDRLVEEELWLPAIDVSTRTGLDRGGVWAAWGKACLRAGRWGQARDKFARCLGGAGSRPLRDPPLLADVLEILEAGAYAPDDRAGGGGTGVVSSPVILHTLSTLKDVAQGRYPEESPAGNAIVIGPKMEPLFYAECKYYLDTYGSHAGILKFYMSHDDLRAALRHALANDVDPDVFYEQIYLTCLRLEQLSELHYELTVIDPHLSKWKVYLNHVCLQLERQKLLNVLYQLQLFMKDYVRAAMTCIRFYLEGARSYTDLAANQESLRDAKKHLEANLDSRNTIADSSQMAMKLDPRELNRHIGTIVRQLEVTKFLRDCEREGQPVPQLTAQVCKGARVPTLFGNNTERIQLAVLVILSARNLEEGFGIAFRIIQDYHLNSERVYCLAGRKLASDGRTSSIEQLIGCVSGSGLSVPASSCDEVLASCIQVLAEKPSLDADALSRLMKLMKDVGNKISAYITCRQLKSAYLLAVKHNRLSDIRRILHEAERLGQTKIKQICLKRLDLHPEV